jgi:hypothetical protein
MKLQIKEISPDPVRGMRFSRAELKSGNIFQQHELLALLGTKTFGRAGV